MWTKALTWKRDKVIEDRISRKRPSEFSKRYEIISALKKTEETTATQIAKQLYEYYHVNKHMFHAMHEEGISRPGDYCATGMFNLLANEDGLFKSGDDSSGLFFLIYKDKIEFYARYKAISEHNFLPGVIQEVEFYRLGNSLYTLNISKYVLFDCILPPYRAIATGKHLTLYEKKIWLNASVFALDYPEEYSVFLLDTQSVEQTAVQITTRKRFNDYFNNRDWMTEVDFMTLTIVITTN
jgi:hypothetical protein